MGESSGTSDRVDVIMLVSVITPTSERARYLQGTYALLQQQTHTDWEWLIYDTSLRPSHFSDPRIVYIHDEAILSIGEKRNRLAERARGEIIVHFDDDDFYAPTYLQMMIDRLRQVSFFTISSWFSYDTKSRQFYYWDTDDLSDKRYILNALTGSRIWEIEVGKVVENQKELVNNKGKKGYGFSFGYRRELFDPCRYPDLDFAEDRTFYEAVEAAHFPLLEAPDHKGIVVHVIHDTNTSSEYPQYRIPRFLMEPLIPDFFPYLATYHEN